MSFPGFQTQTLSLRRLPSEYCIHLVNVNGARAVPYWIANIFLHKIALLNMYLEGSSSKDLELDARALSVQTVCSGTNTFAQ